MPDPFVLACGLSVFVIISAVAVPQHESLVEQSLLHRIPAVADLWLNGLWDAGFLTFALQMCFVLLTGFALAKAPPAVRLLGRLAGRIRTERAAVTWTAALSCAGCWINWGFGLIAAGVFASRLRSEFAARGRRCHGALLVAAAYVGMMIWHGGLSGSAPLKVAESGIALANGKTIAPISIDEMTLSTGNLVLSLVLLVGVPLLIRQMASKTDAADRASIESAVAHPPSGSNERDRTDIGANERQTIADRLNRTAVLPVLVAAVGSIALVNTVRRHGSAAIDLNFVNTVFLVAGLLLHGNLASYVAAVGESGRAIAGIVLQFPFYAGIQGVMQDAGIAAWLSSAFLDGSVRIADALGVPATVTFPIATFLSAGIVNIFVPSGGGQWIVQGPIVCEAAQALGAPFGQAVMALSYGDEWTNMIQPFWAIPLMGQTGVNVREFMGYCALIMLLAAPVYLIALVTLY
jgi:short-chain fatty acids transporter